MGFPFLPPECWAQWVVVREKAASHLPSSSSWEVYCSFDFVYRAVSLFRSKIFVSVKYIGPVKGMLWRAEVILTCPSVVPAQLRLEACMGCVFLLPISPFCPQRGL